MTYFNYLKKITPWSDYDNTISYYRFHLNPRLNNIGIIMIYIELILVKTETINFVNCENKSNKLNI